MNRMKKTLLLLSALILFAAGAAGQCPTAYISYTGTPFCKALTSPQPVSLSGTGAYTGGTYSSTVGLSINSVTGDITPSSSTAGTYTVTYTIAAAGVCPVITATTSVVIVDIPSAPVVGIITQPTCTTSTGSVALSGLPSFGDWTVVASPGGATSTGNGTTTTIVGLLQNTTYTFKVTNYAGCVSSASGSATIQAQPSTPIPPAVGYYNCSYLSCTYRECCAEWSALRIMDTYEVSRRYCNTESGTSTTISGLSQGHIILL